MDGRYHTGRARQPQYSLEHSGPVQPSLTVMQPQHDDHNSTYHRHLHPPPPFQHAPQQQSYQSLSAASYEHDPSSLYAPRPPAQHHHSAPSAPNLSRHLYNLPPASSPQPYGQLHGYDRTGRASTHSPFEYEYMSDPMPNSQFGHPSPPSSYSPNPDSPLNTLSPPSPSPSALSSSRSPAPPSTDPSNGSVAKPKKPSKKRAKRPKKYKCTDDKCQAVFERPSTLRQHMLSHTGEKPHRCHLCARSFSVASNLRRHMKTCEATMAAGQQGQSPAPGLARPTSTPSANAHNHTHAHRPSLPVSLQHFSNSRELHPSPPFRRSDINAVTVPLPPVSPYGSTSSSSTPQSGFDDGGMPPRWEERNSYDNTPSDPYHPKNWPGRLAGPQPLEADACIGGSVRFPH